MENEVQSYHVIDLKTSSLWVTLTPIPSLNCTGVFGFSNARLASCLNKILLDLFFNFEKNENIAEIKKLLQYAMELSKLVRFRETQIRTILKILFVLIVHSTLFYVNFVTHKRVWRDLRHFTTWSIGLLALLSFYFTYILRNKLWGMFIYLRIETLSFFYTFISFVRLCNYFYVGI